MKAVRFARYGGPEVLSLEEVPVPSIDPLEVLVRIEFACVTTADSAARSGMPYFGRLMFGFPRPRKPVLGTDAAGRIVAVGEGVRRLSIGDRVVLATGASFGTHADFVAIAEDDAVAKIPDGVDTAAALAVCEGALTALPFLRDAARVQPGQRVLVNGASGSVGSAAVQLARMFGAQVTAVCSGPNAPLVTSLGADTVIDYTEDDFTAGVPGAPESATDRFHVVFDAVATSSFSRTKRMLHPRGVYLTTVPTVGAVTAVIRTRFIRGKRALMLLTGLRPPAARRADLEWICAAVAEGSLVPVIDSIHDADRARRAHDRVDSRRKRGAVLLDFRRTDA